jgi:hypothetical protein
MVESQPFYQAFPALNSLGGAPLLLFLRFSSILASRLIKMVQGMWNGRGCEKFTAAFPCSPKLLDSGQA